MKEFPVVVIVIAGIFPSHPALEMRDVALKKSHVLPAPTCSTTAHFFGPATGITLLLHSTAHVALGNATTLHAFFLHSAAHVAFSNAATLHAFFLFMHCHFTSPYAFLMGISFAPAISLRGAHINLPFLAFTVPPFFLYPMLFLTEVGNLGSPLLPGGMSFKAITFSSFSMLSHDAACQPADLV
jgi:hypothetical protein